MNQRVRAILSNAGVIGETFAYLWKKKLWWLIPMVFVLFILGLLIVFTTATGVGPFIYTLF